MTIIKHYSGHVTLIRFDDGQIAQIVLDHSATPEHVLDTMDLVRLMLQHGVTAAAIKFQTDPATGGPGSNAASFGKEI